MGESFGSYEGIRLGSAQRRGGRAWGEVTEYREKKEASLR